MRRTWQAIVAVMAVLATSAAWAQRSVPLRVLDPSGSSYNSAGTSVAVDGDTMVVGAPYGDLGSWVSWRVGSAQVYRWTGSVWTFEATLLATDRAEGDTFGVSVAISGDTVVVGAGQDNVGGIPYHGSAYVFTRTGSTWAQQTKLTATGGASHAFFGNSVAISGDTVVVGAVGPNSYQGSAYVFMRTVSTWTQQAQLTALGGAAGDLFGTSVAISGDTVIVGASGDDVSANVDQGSAYVFMRTVSTWTQQAQLTALGGAAGDSFGSSVAISGDTVIVGASADDVSANVDQGSAYVFTRTGTTWTQQAQLSASAGSAGDQFGGSVAISGNTLIAGAAGDDFGAVLDQGSAYVFTRTGSTWMQQTQLIATFGSFRDAFGTSVAISGDTVAVGVPQADVPGPSSVYADWGAADVFTRVNATWIGPDRRVVASDGAGGDNLGFAAAISGDRAIVGASADDVTFADQGSAYIMAREGPLWSQQAKLVASDPGLNDYLGVSVAIDGTTAVAGAAFDDAGAIADQGSVYVFVNSSGTTWPQQAKLVASDGAAGDQFGGSVAISGNTLIAGAAGDDFGAVLDQGSAYVFTRTGTTWTQQAKLVASDGVAGDNFGSSVAILGDTAIVGASGDDNGAVADQGSIYIFTRTGTTWTQQAKLVASDGAAGDSFGRSLAISGDSVIVGARADDVGANNDQGSAYVFTGAGASWTQQAKLVASDGAAGDQFGSSVSISGDAAIVGARTDDIGANSDQGSAYVFIRSGTTWTQRSKLTAPNGRVSDYFGASVGISGVNVLVGVVYDDFGASDQGSAWFFDVEANDLPAASNDVSGVMYPSLAAAMLPAASGQQLTATEAAWRTIGSLNTLGRSLSLQGSADIRTPSSSSLELGGASEVVAAGAAEFFGQLRVSTGSSANVVADAFRLGSRGTLTARTNASLSVSSPRAALDGQTRLEQGAALTFAGSAEAIGSTTCAFESTLVAGTSFTNIDTFTITAGTINTPLFWNRAQFNVFGTSAIFGNLFNNVLATTTIRSGSLFVFGDLTNNGTVIGTICSTCSGLPPSMDVGGTLSLGPAANLTMPFVGSTVHVGGSFDCAINANTRFDMALSTLQMESARPEVTLEVMSHDIGVDALGLDRSRPGHFPIGELHIGGSPTTVRLVDAYDNALDGTNACEALYVDTLRIDAGSRLINTTCRIYYNTLINGGTVDVPENLIPLQGTPCPADFNMDGGVDGGDVVDFFVAWEAGESTADVNQDGGVDGSDIDVFFAAWEAGGC